eukprot:488865-Hanusia_phi.AAC.2
MAFLISSGSAQQSIDVVSQSEMYFAVLPLVHPRARREFSGRTERSEPFTRSDLTLPSNIWSSNVIGALSPWCPLVPLFAWTQSRRSSRRWPGRITSPVLLWLLPLLAARATTTLAACTLRSLVLAARASTYRCL